MQDSTSLITCYQWMDNKTYAGIYEFWHFDKFETIELPARSTLIAPPEDIPEGSEAFWTGIAWDIREKV